MIKFSNIELYTVEDVAEILKLSKQTVYSYVWQGRLKSRHIGRRAYISEQELKDFIGSGHRESEHRVSKGERRQPMR